MNAQRIASVSELVEEARQLGAKAVCITGGEPLLHEEVPVLIKALKQQGHCVSVETNGSLTIEPVLAADLVCVDYKLQGAEVGSPFDSHNLDILRPQDEMKFVIKDRADYVQARELVKTISPDCTLLFSPCNNLVPELPEWLIEDALPVRLSVQLHKLLGFR